MVKRIHLLIHCKLMYKMCNSIYESKGCSNSHPETCERGCNHPQFVPQQAQNHDLCSLRDHEGVHTIVSVMLANGGYDYNETSHGLHVNEVAPQPFDGCGICMVSPCCC